jgi:hypothetical protein
MKVYVEILWKERLKSDGQQISIVPHYYTSRLLLIQMIIN